MSGPPAFDGRARKLRAAYRISGPEGGSPGGRGGHGRGGPRLAPPSGNIYNSSANLPSSVGLNDDSPSKCTGEERRRFGAAGRLPGRSARADQGAKT